VIQDPISCGSLLQFGLRMYGTVYCTTSAVRSSHEDTIFTFELNSVIITVIDYTKM
jgi:hypothetical protein